MGKVTVAKWEDLLVFRPDSTFSLVVNLVTIFVTIVSSWFYAFIAAFSDGNVDEISDIPLILILLSLDLFFLLVIGKKFLTGFYPEGK